MIRSSMELLQSTCYTCSCNFHGSFYLIIVFLIFTLITALSHVSAAAAAFIAPNMSSCNAPSQLPASEAADLSCCAPLTDYAPRLFKPSLSPSALRVRRPAHLVDEAYAEKLARGYALMKALPVEDPRSFVQQANIHCAYCNAVYNQMNSSNLFQVHGTWLFFPFHRWYLYFHERILAKLLDDDNFSLSFWNYDHADGAPIPWLFSTYNLTLIDLLRDPLHAETGAPAAIDFTWDTDTRSWETQLRENNNAIFRSLIRDATSKELFFGSPYGEGGEYPKDGHGTVERMPHNTVHYWVGQKSQPGWKNMGSFVAAARDPLFYAHHASIDRLWEVWKTLPDNYDYEDEGYLNSEFAFYNEDAELVRVRVGDALKASELGYGYEEVENVWMEAVPVRRSIGEAKLAANDSVCVEGEAILVPCSLVMERDAEKVGRGVAEYMELRIEYEPNKAKHIDIYINLPSANAETDSGCEEYYTWMSEAPRYLWGGASSDVNATIWTLRTPDMSARLGALNLTQAASLIVTIVPRALNTYGAPIALLDASIVYSPSQLVQKALSNSSSHDS